MPLKLVVDVLTCRRKWGNRR